MLLDKTVMIDLIPALQMGFVFHPDLASGHYITIN